jgi:hypothetical protein
MLLREMDFGFLSFMFECASCKLFGRHFRRVIHCSPRFARFFFFSLNSSSHWLQVAYGRYPMADFGAADDFAGSRTLFIKEMVARTVPAFEKFDLLFQRNDNEFWESTDMRGQPHLCIQAELEVTNTKLLL